MGNLFSRQKPKPCRNSLTHSNLSKRSVFDSQEETQKAQIEKRVKMSEERITKLLQVEDSIFKHIENLESRIVVLESHKEINKSRRKRTTTPENSTHQKPVEVTLLPIEDRYSKRRMENKIQIIENSEIEKEYWVPEKIEKVCGKNYYSVKIPEQILKKPENSNEKFEMEKNQPVYKKQSETPNNKEVRPLFARERDAKGNFTKFKIDTNSQAEVDKSQSTRKRKLL